jgi:hypothetical protein
MEFQIGKAGAHFSGKADERMMSRPMTGGPPMMEPQVAKWTRDYITKITFFELPDHRVQQERAGRHGLSRHRLKLLREAHHVL